MAIALSLFFWHAFLACLNYRWLGVSPSGSMAALNYSTAINDELIECGALLCIAVSQGIVIFWLRKTLGKRPGDAS
jgi:hypothetical protein